MVSINFSLFFHDMLAVGWQLKGCQLLSGNDSGGSGAMSKAMGVARRKDLRFSLKLLLTPKGRVGSGESSDLLRVMSKAEASGSRRTMTQVDLEPGLADLAVG